MVSNDSTLELAARCFKRRLEPPQLRFRAVNEGFGVFHGLLQITKVYQTTGKVGDGSYDTCKGRILRYRFYVCPTSEATSLVTITSDLKGTMTPKGIWGPSLSLTCSVSGDAGFCAAARSSYDSWMTIDGFNRLEDSDWHQLSAEWWRCPMEICVFDAREEVVLMYWPPASSDGPCDCDLEFPQDGTSRIVVPSAITFQGQDPYELKSHRDEIGSSVLSRPLTFISPTIYLAHHDITAVTISFMSYDLNAPITHNYSWTYGEFMAPGYQTILRSFDLPV
jgi:hypothetical protein